MKAVPLAEDMNDIVNDIVSSYEARIQSIGAIFDTTHQILEGFHDSFLDTKQEREKVNAELRESLARNESLRKKDFDNMMKGILSTQDEREKEVRNLLNSYLNEQREMAQILGESLGKFKDSLARGEVQRVKEFQALIKGILAKQDERKDEVSSKLKEFQKEQNELASRLKGLLAKGREFRIKDLKLMLNEFKKQHRERIALWEGRKEEVRSMLGDFKKKRRGKNGNS
jgi:transcription termination factor NusB